MPLHIPSPKTPIGAISLLGLYDGAHHAWDVLTKTFDGCGLDPVAIARCFQSQSEVAEVGICAYAALALTASGALIVAVWKLIRHWAHHAHRLARAHPAATSRPVIALALAFCAFVVGAASAPVMINHRPAAPLQAEATIPPHPVTKPPATPKQKHPRSTHRHHSHHGPGPKCK